MRKHINIVVAGRVQGVFFRASTKTSADHFNIKGLVKNLPDGSVYIEAEGEEKDLEPFIKWCAHGPKAAKVENYEVKDGAMKGFTDFVIER